MFIFSYEAIWMLIKVANGSAGQHLVYAIYLWTLIQAFKWELLTLLL